jgi:predicted nucleotide-binding protein
MPRQTIFYSWQSDVGKSDKSSPDVTKEFIFKALAEALRQLIEEYPELSSVDLDRDTRGLAGSPSLVDAILRKINESCLFVADLTFVGQTADQESKKLPNPNVMFELGHASNRLGWDRLILVMNTHYGEPLSLPFDIRHRRFPIKYRLAPNATDSEFKKQQKRLVKELKYGILSAYQQGLFNRYVNEGQVRAALWILRAMHSNARFLFETIATEFKVYPFHVTDTEKIEQVVKHVTAENFQRLRSISHLERPLYLPYFINCLQSFVNEIDQLLFRYTHVGGNLINSLEEVRLRTTALLNNLQLINNINPQAASKEAYDRNLQSQAKRLLLEIRQCLIEARTIRNEPIEG